MNYFLPSSVMPAQVAASARLLPETVGRLALDFLPVKAVGGGAA